MSQIHVVTDSTCDIPRQLAQAWNISVVPCYINFGTESFLDQVELSRKEFYQRLISDPQHPTTAAPPAGLFTKTYEKLLDNATGIISIHPPDHITALRQSALNGWDLTQSDIPYMALDAGHLSIALGQIVIQAAQAAAAGESLSAIQQLVADLRERVHLFAGLSTIKFLHRSGRVGWARGAIGRLLRVRPLLHIYQGEINSLGHVRTTSKVMGQLLAQLQELGDLECLSILHSNAPALATQFKELLPRKYLSDDILTINVTPILGTHVGPNAIGYVAIQK